MDGGGSGTTLAGLLEKLAQFGSGPRGPGTRVYLRPVEYVGQALLTLFTNNPGVSIFQASNHSVFMCTTPPQRLGTNLLRNVAELGGKSAN